MLFYFATAMSSSFSIFPNANIIAVYQVAANDIIHFGMASYLLAIVAERRKWFLCFFYTAVKDQGYKGRTHSPPGPLSPAKRRGKEVGRGRKGRMKKIRRKGPCNGKVAEQAEKTQKAVKRALRPGRR